MRRIDEFLAMQRLPGVGQRQRKIAVTGYLIGAMPKGDTKNSDERDLIYELDHRPAGSNWDVLGLEHVLERAQVIHGDAINAFERERPEDVAVAVSSRSGGSGPKRAPKKAARASSTMAGAAVAPPASTAKTLAGKAGPRMKSQPVRPPQSPR